MVRTRRRNNRDESDKPSEGSKAKESRRQESDEGATENRRPRSSDELAAAEPNRELSGSKSRARAATRSVRSHIDTQNSNVETVLLSSSLSSSASSAAASASPVSKDSSPPLISRQYTKSDLEQAKEGDMFAAEDTGSLKRPVQWRRICLRKDSGENWSILKADDLSTTLETLEATEDKGPIAEFGMYYRLIQDESLSAAASEEEGESMSSNSTVSSHSDQDDSDYDEPHPSANQRRARFDERPPILLEPRIPEEEGEDNDDEIASPLNAFDMEESTATEDITFGYSRGVWTAEEIHCRDGTGVGAVEEELTPEAWRDVDFDKIDVSIDGARELMFAQAIRELDALHKCLHEKGIDKTFAGLAKYIFGEKSSLAHLLMTELELDFSTYARFLASFFAAAEWKAPLAKLHEDEDYNSKDLMNPDQYNAIWAKISYFGADDEGNNVLWQQLEDALNKLLKDLFLSQRLERYMIALDDDKAHFQWSFRTALKRLFAFVGLKQVQHVRDNRRGFTFHTAANPASGFPLYVAAQRTRETIAQTYKRMVDAMFGHRAGQRPGEILQNVTFFSDRGYWCVELLAYLLMLGAEVLGTVMRCAWFPFTYDQKLKEGDNRQQVSKKGGKTSFFKTIQWAGQKIMAIAYRSGTGAVCLNMTTEYRRSAYDFTIRDAAWAKWYKEANDDERLAKAFRSVSEQPKGSGRRREQEQERQQDEGRDDDQEEQQQQQQQQQQPQQRCRCRRRRRRLPKLFVRLRTCLQNWVEWFHDRAYSCTSSTTDVSIHAAAPFIRPDSPYREAFEVVLSYTGMESLLPEEEDEEEEIGEYFEGIDIPTGKWVKKINDDDGDPDLAASLVEVCTDKLITGENAKIMLNQIGVDKSRAAKMSSNAAFAKLKVWANAKDEKSPCPYKDILTVKEMKALISKRSPQATVPTQRDELSQALVELDESPGAELPEAQDEALRFALLRAVIKASHMKELPKSAKEYAKRGHDLELTILKNLLQHSKEGKTGEVRLEDIFQVGMAQSEDDKHVKGSADGIAVEECENDVDEVELDEEEATADEDDTDWIVEAKARLGKNAFREAREIKTSNTPNGRDPAVVVYKHFCTASDAKAIARWIPDEHERVQILHNAVVWKKKRAVIVVSDGDGGIMYGVFVQFHDELIKSYKQVLQLIFDKCLALFYGEMHKMPFRDIEKILASTKGMKNMTLDDVITHYMIWRRLNVEVDSEAIKFPLPPCSKIILWVLALWNAAKGGSDTITKLIWNCIPVLPIKTPQSTICGRLFILYGVVLHRLVHATTNQKDFKDYVTLEHLRNAGTHRKSFHKTLHELKKYFIMVAANGKGPATDEGTNEDFEMADAPPLTRSNQSVRYAVDHRVQGSIAATGKTPKKGRGRQLKNQDLASHAFEERANNCPGCPDQMMTLQDDKFVPLQLPCDFCKGKSSFKCRLCKLTFCYNLDRSQKFADMYNKDPNMFSTNGAPACILKTGTTIEMSSKGLPKGAQPVPVEKSHYIRYSCFHYKHPQYLGSPSATSQDVPSASSVPAPASAPAPAPSRDSRQEGRTSGASERQVGPGGRGRGSRGRRGGRGGRGRGTSVRRSGFL